MISFECPSCGKRLNAPDEGAGRDGRCGCGATFTIPHHGDAAEPIECEPDPLPRRRRKSAAPPALVIGVVFLLGIVTVSVVVAALVRNASVHERPNEVVKQKTPKKESNDKPRRDPRWTVDDEEVRPAQRRHNDSADSGMSNVTIGVIALAVLLAYIVFVVLLAIWVVKDCRNRSIENGIFWMLLIFPFNVLGFIIYLASRPNGTLVRCEHCRNKRLAFVGVCPHCHQDVRSRGAGPD